MTHINIHDRVQRLEEDMVFWKDAVLNIQKQHIRLQERVYKL